jgi:hypothetical protein
MGKRNALSEARKNDLLSKIVICVAPASWFGESSTGAEAEGLEVESVSLATVKEAAWEDFAKIRENERIPIPITKSFLYDMYDKFIKIQPSSIKCIKEFIVNSLVSFSI